MPDGQMPPDPIAQAHEGYVGLHVMYLGLRHAGWSILAAAAFVVANYHYVVDEAQNQDGSG